MPVLFAGWACSFGNATLRLDTNSLSSFASLMFMSRTLHELCPLVLEQMKEYAAVLLDPEGAIAWMNGSAEQLFGHKFPDVAGKRADFLFVPEDIAQGVFQHEMETAAARDSMENDRWMVRADGSRFWANGAMFPLRNAEGELVGFAKMLRNRTDLRQQLETLRNEIAVLVESGKQKDTILGVASHELRNPLFATTVAVDTIRRAVPDTPQLAHPFGVIDRQLQSIRRLLDDITDATQASAGRLKLRRERVDLRHVVQRSLETMRPAIASRRHTVQESMLAVEIPVDGDADRLHQVVTNLIDNAVKYTPPGGRIVLAATTEGNEAVLKIDDDGIGIPPDMQASIFELFTRVPNPDTLNEKGLGIGLSLVKNLVAQHGGTIQVRSNGAGSGSEFTIRLPLATSSAAGST